MLGNGRGKGKVAQCDIEEWLLETLKLLYSEKKGKTEEGGEGTKKT